jgi:small subunit ribosomal protein S1
VSGDLKLARDEHPIPKTVFVAMSYGSKVLANGATFDHDEFYADELAPAIEEADCTPERADSIYGPESLIGTIWTGLQRSEIFLADFTGKSANVALECGWAILLRKKMIILAQDPGDIPADLRGRFRYIRYSDRWNDMKKMREELVRQLEALLQEPLREMGLMPVTTASTDLVPGTVVTTTKEFAVIEAAGDRRGVLANTDVDYSRVIPDMSKHFTIGERVSGAFDVDASGVPKYTLLAGIPNPWTRIREDLPQGTSFPGTVRRMKEDLGAFVDVGNGLSGLIHASALGGRVVAVGDQVDVTIRHIDVDRRRIALHLDAVRPAARPAGKAPAMPASETAFRPGQRLEAEVHKVVPQPGGGYLLVRIPGRTAPAMLHSKVMTPELRDDLTDGQVEEGELLDVEVVSVDLARGRLCVRDLPDDGTSAPPDPSDDVPASAVAPEPALKPTGAEVVVLPEPRSAAEELIAS